MKQGIFLAFFLILIHLNVSGQNLWKVYVFLAEECPVCNYMGKPLSDIAKKYSSDVSFHAVFPLKNSNAKTAQLFKEQYDMMSFETVLDKNQTLAKDLGATVTPEVIVTNMDGEVYYRGRINSAYYAPGKMKHSGIRNDLDEALAALIAGQKVSQPWSPAIGCYITMYASR
jgi:thiol-disulfide isomerase/thioredoxin